MIHQSLSKKPLCVYRPCVRSYGSTAHPLASAVMSGIRLFATKLVNKSILRLRGPESFPYLQLFLTNDIRHLIGGDGGRKHCIYSHLVNSNGRTLVDLFVYKPFTEPAERSMSRNLVLAPFHIDNFATGGYETDELLIECPSSLASALHRMLFAMKIRKKLTIESCDMDIWSVYPCDPLAFGDENVNFTEMSSPDFVLSRDPRIPILGHRILSRLPISGISDLRRMLSLDEGQLIQQSVKQYQRFLHSLGVGEGPDDHPHGLVFPMECNADILNGISFMKGMHTADWLTGRNVRRGVSSRIMPVTIINFDKNSRTLLPPDSAVLLSNGHQVGVIRSVRGRTGLASLKWNQVVRELRDGGGELVHEISGCRLKTGVPHWWRQGIAGLPADHPRRFPVAEHFLALR